MWGLRTATVCATLIVVSLAQELIVVGPNSFRANQNYMVTIFNMMNKEVTLEASMECFEDNGSVTFNETKPVVVPPKICSEVKFKIPYNRSTKSGRITIDGKTGLVYKKEVSVHYNGKSFSGFIQLSKPVYKPGDSVQFRVIVLDPDLRPPSDLKVVNVTVKNPNRDNIRKWRNVKLYNGVFEGQLYIAPSPPPGIYNITVEANNEKLVSKTFEVKEYVLSTFVVDVYPNVIPLEEHHALNLTIAANYYFGKPVIGRAKFQLYDGDNNLELSKEYDVNGKLHVHLPLSYQLLFDDDGKHNVILNVTFTEQHTNRTVSLTPHIVVFEQKYQVRLLGVPEFNPKTSNGIKLMVEYQDGKPAKAVTLQVELKHKDGNQVENCTSNAHGIITLRGWSRFSSDEEIEMTVLSDEVELLSDTLRKAKSKMYFLEIRPPKAKLNPQQSLKLKVVCSHSMTFVLYYIVSKGKVVDYGAVKIFSRLSHDINLSKSATIKMIPRSSVLVATVIGNTFVYDVVTIDSEHFTNNIELKLKGNQRELKPDDTIELLITGLPKSYVALASYDKSLLQHERLHQEPGQQDHDISRENILNMFEEHNPHTYTTPFGGIGLFVDAGNLAIEEVEDKSARADVSPNQYQLAQLYSYRTDFHESWLWGNITLPKKGSFTLREPTPDSIASWYLTGFSIDPVHGFGIIKKPLQFTTVLPFYIVDNLPYSIRRGEAVMLQFTLFNSFGSDYYTNVQLKKINDQFEFVGVSPEAETETKQIIVPANASAPISFLVKAKTLGEMTIHVVVSTFQGHQLDSIERHVRVLPDNIIIKIPVTRIFWHDSSSSSFFPISLDLNRKAVPGTAKLLLHVSPNLVLKVSQNIDNLVLAAKDTGDQNMMNFAPYVVILRYEEAMGTKDSEIFKKAANLLQSGYQSQLKFRQADGSFGVWKNKGGSVFVTAFAVQWMIVAEKYYPDKISFHSDVISKAFEWLASKQQDNGSFMEDGSNVYKDLQTNDRNGIALTSFVMVAFMKLQKVNNKYEAIIEKGMAYIADRFNTTGNSFDLSIATYALYLNDHQLKEVALNELFKVSTKVTNNYQRFWDTTTSPIETAAFALLSITEANRVADGIEVMRWLVNQIYEIGTFQNSFDTSFGLLAIANFTNIISTTRNDYTIEMSYSGEKTNYRINPSMKTTLMKEFVVPKNEKTLNLTVYGTGTGLLQILLTYELHLKDHKNQFDVTVEQLNTASATVLKLYVCSRFNSENRAVPSNMAIVEVNLPSGYVLNSNPISNSTDVNKIKETKILYGKTTVEVFYEQMDYSNNCFTVTAYRLFSVTYRRPAYIKVHDVYKPEHLAIVYYTVEKEDVCDIYRNGCK